MIAGDVIEDLRERLQTRQLGRSLQWHDITDSTMDEGHAAIEAGAPHGHTIIAGQQRMGRGARGRSWYSPAGSHLYLSVVLRGQPVLGLTLVAGLAVADAVHALGASSPWVKWPNDVWIGSPPAKVAGVLVEARSSAVPDAVVLGVGLNLRRDALPDDVDAAALENVSVVDAAATLLKRLEFRLSERRQHGLAHSLDQLRARLLWVGRRVRVDETLGTLVGLDATGALVIESAEGLQTLRAGQLRLDD